LGKWIDNVKEVRGEEALIMIMGIDLIMKAIRPI
jgi:hypothetical protein